MAGLCRRASTFGLLPALAVASLSGVAGCSTSSGALPTTPVVRSTGVTAPADLQLICASEAASQFNVAGGRVLPVSSMQDPGGGFQVNLTMEGGQAVCFIDSAGTIQAIQRV